MIVRAVRAVPARRLPRQIRRRRAGSATAPHALRRAGLLRGAGPVRRRRPRRHRRLRDPDRRAVDARRRRRRGGRHRAHPRERRPASGGARGSRSPRDYPPHRRARRDADPARGLLRPCAAAAALPRPCAEPERAAVPAACTGRRSTRSTCTAGRISDARPTSPTTRRCDDAGDRLRRAAQGGLTMDAAALDALARTHPRQPRPRGQGATSAPSPTRLGLARRRAVPVGDDCAAIPDGDGHLLFAIEGFINAFVAADPWFAGWCGVMVNSQRHRRDGRPPDRGRRRALGATARPRPRPMLDGLRAAARGLWRADRRRPHQPAQRRSASSPSRSSAARAAPADELRRAPGRRPRRGDRPARRLPRAVRQLARRARTRRRRGCAATSRCCRRSPRPASRAPPRTSARAASSAPRSMLAECSGVGDRSSTSTRSCRRPRRRRSSAG